VKTVFGKMPFVVFGMTPRDTDRILGRCNIKLLKGRMPIDGAAEVAMSEEIARNQRIKIGDVVLKPDSEDSFAAIPAKLVGTFKGPVWLAVTTRRFIEENFPVAPEGVIITSPDHPSRSEMAEEQSVLDKRIGDVIDKGRGRQWTYATLVRETHDSLSSLYLILNVVIGIVVFAIAFLVGMLSNIYFTQRLPEFATLAAIGHSRRSMMARAISETAVLCGVGWLLGAFCTYLLLRVLQIVLMEPRGLLLNPVDFTAYFYTLPLPLAIAGFAVFAIGIKLKRLDPITVIERRA
jgi:predicted lysophospholipase L1 biosynthesis ABC-type transport system permease subunit